MVRMTFLAAALAVGCQTAAPAPKPPPPRPSEVRTTAPPTPREAPAELKELRRQIAELRRKALDAKRTAHERLDQEKYEEAKAAHQESIELARLAEETRRREGDLVKAAALRLVADLDDDDIGVRESATRDLLELGADPALFRGLTKNLTGEAKQRAELILGTLEERLFERQWASEATASTEYNRPSWAAAQAAGAPNTAGAGDHSTAWASKDPDGDSEWLALTYSAAVEPTMVRVHETYNPGAIVKVELRDATGAWRTVWEGVAAAAPAPRWFEVKVQGEGWTTKEVRLTLDSDAVPGWNEIDAVELVGRRPDGTAPR